MVMDIVWSLGSERVDFTKEDIECLLYYVKYHDDRVSRREKHPKRHLNWEVIEFYRLLELRFREDMMSSWGTNMKNTEIYIVTIESYEWTKLYGVFSDKEFYYELCEGGREEIAESLQIANAKKKKEAEWNALLGI